MQNRWKKLIKSLHLKKNRLEEGLFLVEGAKSVAELLAGGPGHLPFKLAAVFFTEKFAEEYPDLATSTRLGETVSQAELEQVGTLQTNEAALVVVEMPAETDLPLAAGQWALALADLRDPGNLGTLVRLADWYGLPALYCSPSTADWYNPKVIAASMGGFLRVRPVYTELGPLLAQAPGPVYAATLQGQSVHQLQRPAPGVLLIGNEARGLAPDLVALASQQVAVPRFGGAESLNAAVATAIILDNLYRASGCPL
ncbi:MAG: RNA methyltransferase [Bernardetiaceae bacterium]|jgi:TrmH family RNA methyltransferase|nr:RNA methyltransferase [Bernardetiaceae bacterium]